MLTSKQNAPKKSPQNTLQMKTRRNTWQQLMWHMRWRWRGEDEGWTESVTCV